MLDEVAFYCFRTRNWFSNLNKAFYLILVSKYGQKGHLAYFKTFWRPFWKVPSIWNLQNIENMQDDMASFWLKSILDFFKMKVANISLLNR